MGFIYKIEIDNQIYIGSTKKNIYVKDKQNIIVD